MTRLADPDWTTSGWAYGPAVAQFLTGYIERQGLPQAAWGESLARRLNAWASGATVSFWTLDHYLAELGLHPSELPPDVWLAERPYKGR